MKGGREGEGRRGDKRKPVKGREGDGRLRGRVVELVLEGGKRRQREEEWEGRESSGVDSTRRAEHRARRGGRK